MNYTAIISGLLALAAAGPVLASTLTFTSRGTWESSVTSLSNFDGGTQAAGTSTGVANGGIFYTNLQINAYNTDTSHPMSLIRANAGPSTGYYDWGTGTIIRTEEKTAYTAPFARIVFPAPVSAFGFNYGVGGCPTFYSGCSPGSIGSVTISPNGMTPINVTTAEGPVLAFLGVTSDTQTFSYADIFVADSTRYIVLDNVAQGSALVSPPAEETPEPGSLLLFAAGFVLVGLARRRVNREGSRD